MKLKIYHIVRAVNDPSTRRFAPTVLRTEDKEEEKTALLLPRPQDGQPQASQTGRSRPGWKSCVIAGLLLAVFSLTVPPAAGAVRHRHIRPTHSTRPIITKLDPASVEYLVPGATNPQTLTLHVTGKNFQAGSVIWLEKTPLPTTLVSEGELQAVASFAVVTQGMSFGGDRPGGSPSFSDHLRVTVHNPPPNAQKSRPALLERISTIVGG